MVDPSDDTKKSNKVQNAKSETKDKAKIAKEAELSEEDQNLKTELESLAQTLQGSKRDEFLPSISQMGTLIRTSTSSMTAVPKPLKFLRPHYHDLKKTYETWSQGPAKEALSDVLSVLAMTYADGNRDCLKFRLASPAKDYLSWGHEYIRHLSIELGEERADLISKQADGIEPLKKLVVEDIAPFFLSHNAEADAVDLLSEFDVISTIVSMVDAENYSKVCLYIISCVGLLPYPENVEFLQTAYRIYCEHKQSASAMLVAIRLDDHTLIKEVWEKEKDVVVKRQLGFLLGRQTSWMEEEDQDPEFVKADEAIRNMNISFYYTEALKTIGLADEKVPEDIYKSHLEPEQGIFGRAAIDSAQQNLASTFANAFINAGRCSDKLIMTPDEKNSWIYKNKDAGQLSATASMGLISMWDTDIGVHATDKYFYSKSDYIKAGALMGVGISACNVRLTDDPALAILDEWTEHKNLKLRTAAIISLGFAYAGSQREYLQDLLLEVVTDTTLPMEVSSLAALSLGFIFAGSCNGQVADDILQTLLERDSSSPTQLDDKWTRYMTLGLGLLYIGKQEEADMCVETLKAIDHKVAKHAQILVEILAYAGTGNVLKIQQMLHLTAEHPKEVEQKEGEEAVEPEADLSQAFATIGIAMIAMGEDIGTEMALRQFGHLMHYSEPIIRRAVPLAMGLLSASNPQMKVFEILSRYSHDADMSVATNAIFAMGMVGAGTNNARLAQLLRGLATYYSKSADCLFMVRIAQGLLHAGQGTMSINPFHSDRSILHRNGLAGITTVIVALLESKAFLLDNDHWLLLYLTHAFRMRLLITTNEKGIMHPVSVRVGQAVDSFGPGNARKITGWVTQTTPVLLNYEQRAELATEEWISLTPVLEGVVIVKKNPNYEE